MSPQTFEGDFKKFFGRGLAILLPSILTLWILWQAFVFVFSNVAGPINAGTRAAIVWVVSAWESNLIAIVNDGSPGLRQYKCPGHG